MSQVIEWFNNAEFTLLKSLANFEVERIEKAKARSSTSSIATNAFNPAQESETDNLYADEVARYQKEIDFIKATIAKIDRIIGTSRYGVVANENYEHKENKPNGGN